MKNIDLNDGYSNEAEKGNQQDFSLESPLFEGDLLVSNHTTKKSPLDDLNTAKLAYEHVLLSCPSNAEALHGLGLIAYQSGDYEQATKLLAQAVSSAPGNSSMQNDLGGLLNLQGRLKEAETCFRHALVLDPANVQALYNLGCVLQSQDRQAEAESSYRQALAIHPESTQTICNLGSCLHVQGKIEEAISFYRQALAISPTDISALNNLGVSLQAANKLDEAEACFEQTIKICPTDPRAYVNLGLVWYERGEYEKALRCNRQALEIKPNHPEAIYSIGVSLQALCRHAEAITWYQKALELKEDHHNAHHNLLMAQIFIPDVSPTELFAAHKRFGEQFEALLKPHWPNHENGRDGNRRLKVGYVSGDFRAHAVAYFFEPILDHHDRSQFEIFCYSNNFRDDSFTDRLKLKTDHWISCRGLSDDQMAQRILADGIDILVDLAGHTAHNRLLAFARKPAPIQITYLGYPGTSGLSAMDYRLTDNYTEPDIESDADRYYTERLLRLPNSMWCFRPGDDVPAITPLPALTNGYLTFGSFNNINKIGEGCINLWAKLLHSLPTSRLLMATIPPGEAREKITRLFVMEGISESRLSFHGKLPTLGFQRLIQQVDIMLDPFPINGATTTCESLWLGVPVLTLIGNRFLSRAGYSVLSAAGLPDFAASTPEGLIKTAGLLANNLSLLAGIRSDMRNHLRGTPLFDQNAFTRDLEQLMRGVWKKWCEDHAS